MKSEKCGSLSKNSVGIFERRMRMNQLSVIYENEKEWIFSLADEDLEIKFSLFNKPNIGKEGTIFLMESRLMACYYELKNGVFFPRRGGVPEEFILKTNALFFELFRQLKKHPTYRLKLLPVFDEECRKLWNKIS